jgi:hypothetical protein
MAEMEAGPAIQLSFSRADDYVLISKPKTAVAFVEARLKAYREVRGVKPSLERVTPALTFNYRLREDMGIVLYVYSFLVMLGCGGVNH